MKTGKDRKKNRRKRSWGFYGAVSLGGYLKKAYSEGTFLGVDLKCKLRKTRRHKGEAEWKTLKSELDAPGQSTAWRKMDAYFRGFKE
jgi:hypothetical protein